MNILMIPSWYENNNNKTLGSFFREQAESLVKRGNNVYVLYTDIIRFNETNRMIKTAKLHCYTKNGLNVFRVKKIKLPKIKEKYVCKMVSDGIEELYLRYLYKKIDIDVIHAHSFIWGGYAGINLSKKYNIPIMVTEHYTGYARNIFTVEEKEIIRYSINSAHRIVAVSTGLKTQLLNYIDKDKRIDVIPNMVDTEIFIPDFNKIENEKFTFLTVCYLMHKKGIDILLKAFNRAFKNQKNIRLVIGGDGEEKIELMKIVKQLSMEEQVEFIGFIERDRVVKEMGQCDCFVLPSRYETFGVVYIEALAMGKPVIATNTDAIYDIIDKSNGLIVTKENEDELVEALIKIKENYSEYNSKNISRNCIKKFGKENISKNIERYLIDTITLYNNMVEGDY